MKTKIESLVEKLTNTEPVCCENYERKILIGDVLEKMNEYPYKDSAENSVKLLRLWKDCGPNRSLQEIFSCGWEKGLPIYKNGIGLDEVERLKDPNAQKLAECLLTLFPNDQ